MAISRLGTVILLGTLLGALALPQAAIAQAPDEDLDGIADFDDNCTRLANPMQFDTDLDGFGNRCDPDLDGDCIVTLCEDPFDPLDPECLASGTDQGEIAANVGLTVTTGNPDADLDGDGLITAADVAIAIAFGGVSPGPSALAACGQDIGAVPASLAFGEVEIGSSIALVVQITNDASATADLVVRDLRITGDSSGEFILVAPLPSDLPLSVAPGASQDVTVRFDPSLEALATASLEVTSNDPDGVLGVNLAGRGVPAPIPLPNVDADPPALDFEDVDLGGWREEIVTVHNLGDADLTLTGGVALAIGSAPEFEIVTAPGAGTILVPGAMANVVVRFTPSAEPPVAGQLEIASDDPDEPLVIVDLVGRGRVVGPTCGDAVLELPEQCDDGNLDPGDGCGPDCRSETASAEGLTVDVEDNGDGTFDYLFVDDAGRPVVEIEGHDGLLDLGDLQIEQRDLLEEEPPLPGTVISIAGLDLAGATKSVFLPASNFLCALDTPDFLAGEAFGTFADRCLGETDGIRWSLFRGNVCGAGGPVAGRNRSGDEVAQVCEQVVHDDEPLARMSGFAHTSIVSLPHEVATIDVRPLTPRNRIAARPRFWIPVAILGSDGLEVRDVEDATLSFGPDGAEPLHGFVAVLDVNHDDVDDLLTVFRYGETGLPLGEGRACITGRIGGIPFVGCDAVEVFVPRCGMGLEPALLLPALFWLRRRRPTS